MAIGTWKLEISVEFKPAKPAEPVGKVAEPVDKAEPTGSRLYCECRAKLDTRLLIINSYSATLGNLDKNPTNTWLTLIVSLL